MQFSLSLNSLCSSKGIAPSMYMLSYCFPTFVNNSDLVLAHPTDHNEVPQPALLFTSPPRIGPIRPDCALENMRSFAALATTAIGGHPLSLIAICIDIASLGTPVTHRPKVDDDKIVRMALLRIFWTEFSTVDMLTISMPQAKEGVSNDRTTEDCSTGL